MRPRHLASTTLPRLGLLAVLTGAGVGGGLALDAGTQAVLGSGPTERVQDLATLTRDARARDAAGAQVAAAGRTSTPTPQQPVSPATPSTPTRRTTPEPVARTVTVRTGQGLWWIADTYVPATTGPVSISRAVRRLRDANPGLRSTGDWLRPGQRLRLPAR